MPSIIKRLAFGSGNIFAGTSKLEFISIGVVRSIDDDGQAGRIIVDIKGVDDKTAPIDKVAAFPLIPKHLQVMPKVGESVFILKLDLKDSEFINRFWIGPIISQPQKLNNDPHFFTSQAALPSGQVSLEEAPKFKPSAKGVFPNDTDIALQGRNNSDVILKPNEVLLRAGQHKIGEPLVFNSDNIGYIQIKYNVPIQTEKNKTKNLTVANIVADKINLISHKGQNNFAVSNNDNLISDNVMTDIINNAHPLPYGDVLLEFIQATKAYILNHVHPYNGVKSVANQAIADNFINFNLDRINSKNIKID